MCCMKHILAYLGAQTILAYLIARKFYIRSNNNKVDSIETGHMVIAYLLPRSDSEKCMHITLFQFIMIKVYRHYLIFKYNFYLFAFLNAVQVKK